MVLTKRAIEAADKQDTRLKLALALGFTEAWIIRLLENNKPDGPLTTYTALKVLKEETQLSEEDILEPEGVDSVQK